MEIVPRRRHRESWWPHKPWPIAAVLVIVVFALGRFVPEWRTKHIRNGIAVGSAAEDVLGRDEHWLFFRIYAGPREKRTVYWEAWPTSYGAPASPPLRTFSNRLELARTLVSEMRAQRTNWRATLVYTAGRPEQALFDVDFSPEGHVTGVSQIRWGIETLE